MFSKASTGSCFSTILSHRMKNLWYLSLQRQQLKGFVPDCYIDNFRSLCFTTSFVIGFKIVTIWRVFFFSLFHHGVLFHVSHSLLIWHFFYCYTNLYKWICLLLFVWGWHRYPDNIYRFYHIFIFSYLWPFFFVIVLVFYRTSHNDLEKGSDGCWVSFSQACFVALRLGKWYYKVADWDKDRN